MIPKVPEDPRPRPQDDAPPVPPLGDDDGVADPPDAGDLPAGFVEESGTDLLDDRTGESEEIESLEEELGGEDGWTADSDPDEANDEDSDEASDAEDGWTEDTEVGGADDWEDDLVTDGRPEEIGNDLDDGDEGPEESDLGTPVDLEPAPLEEQDEVDDDVEGPEVFDEGADEEPLWQLPPSADPATVLVRYLGPKDQAISCVAILDDEVWATGGDAFTGRPEGLLRVEDPALEGVEIQSVALLPGPSGRTVAVGSVVGGCLVQRGASGAFESANGWAKGPARGALVVSSDGSSLLGRASDGQLFRSRDAAASWSRVDAGARAVGAAMTGSRIVAVVIPDGLGPALASSNDDGATFTRTPLPISAAMVIGAEVSVSLSGDSVLVAAEELGAVLYSADGGRTFERWTCPVALAGALDPNDPATAYLSFFHAARDEGAVAVTRDAGRTFVTLAEMSQLRRAFRLDEQGDPDGDNRIHAIVLDRVPGRVYLASAAGAFVLAVRPA